MLNVVVFDTLDTNPVQILPGTINNPVRDYNSSNWNPQDLLRPQNLEIKASACFNSTNPNRNNLNPRTPPLNTMSIHSSPRIGAEEETPPSLDSLKEMASHPKPSLQPTCLYKPTSLPCNPPAPNINQARRLPPINQNQKKTRPSVTTCGISNRRAQDACEAHLAALQKVKKQRLSKKQEHHKERKQAELEENQSKDVAAAEQEVTNQATKTDTATNFPNDQHDPGINRNLSF